MPPSSPDRAFDRGGAEGHPSPAFTRPIAHRGLHDCAQGVIENSASAFSRAIEGGFDIECDLQLSSDGVPVVFHDDDLPRLTGREGRVAGLSAAELTLLPLMGSAARDCPQSLDALLEQVAGRQMLVIELKHQSLPEARQQLARAVTESLSRYRGPVVVESFDPDLLVRMRAAGYPRHLGIILARNGQRAAGSNGRLKGFYLRHMLHWPRTQFSFMSCEVDGLDLPMVRFWRARGLPVTVWTVRSAETAARVRSQADQVVFEGYMPHLG